MSLKDVRRRLIAYLLVRDRAAWIGCVSHRTQCILDIKAPKPGLRRARVGASSPATAILGEQRLSVPIEKVQLPNRNCLISQHPRLQRPRQQLLPPVRQLPPHPRSAGLLKYAASAPRPRTAAGTIPSS